MSAIEILEKLAVNTDLTFNQLSNEEKQKLNKYLGEKKQFNNVHLNISEPDPEEPGKEEPDDKKE